MTETLGRSLLARYCLDSSFFIDLFDVEGEFSKDVFVGVWDALEQDVNQGGIIAPEVVKTELLETKNEGQRRWVYAHGAMFVPLDMGQIVVLKDIVRAYPKYAREPRNLADPGVIALGKCDGLTVLTSEKRVSQHSKAKPKIPNVCEDFDVKHLGILAWCREEGIKVVQSSD